MEKKQIYSTSVAHLLNDLMTVGIVPALLPLYKIAFHLTYTQTGLIVLISYLASSVMQPVFGLVTDKSPKIWALPLGVLLTGIGLGTTGYVNSYVWLLIAIGISGLGSGIFHPEASRSVFLASGHQRGKAQAIFQVGGNSGQALGVLIIPVYLLSAGLKGMWLFGAFGLIACLTVLWMIPWYRVKLQDHAKANKTIKGKNRPVALTLLVIVVIFRSWTQVGISGFLPFYYQDQGISLSVAETFIFLFLGAGAISTYVFGRMSDRISRKSILLWSMIVTTPFAFILPYTSGILSIVDLILFGFSMLASFAVTVVYGQLLLPGKISMASGLMIGFGVGAGGIGATLFGSIADTYGVNTIMHLFAVFTVLAAVVTAFIPSDKTLTE